MQNEASKRPFYRKKRTWLLLLVLMPLALLGLMVFNSHRQLQKQLAELQEAGLPTNGDELNDYYAVPEGQPDSTDAWLRAIVLASDPEFQNDCKPHPIIGIADTPEIGEAWPDLAKSREFLSSHQEVLDAIRTAAEQGGAVRFPVDFQAGLMALLKETQEARALGRILSLDAHVSHRDQKHAQVLKDIIHSFAISDALQHEPTFVSQLVRFALYSTSCDDIRQFLPVSNWDDSQLELLQNAVARIDAKQAVETAMNGERATCLHVVDQNPLFPGMAQSNKLEFLRQFAASEKAMESSWCEAIEMQQAAADEFKKAGNPISRFRRTFVYLLLPASEQALKAGARMNARQLCTIAAIAAERFRLANDKFPESLDSIPAEYLPPSFANTKWIDPFSDKPLTYLNDATGITIYSVGEDQTDDGGNVVYSEDNRATDVGLNIPLTR